jgi:uncharacterized protein
MIARTVASTFSSSTQLPPVLILTGPRATGKTHLAQTLFPAHRHITLALPSEAARGQLDPAAFLTGHPPPVVFDDAHMAPRLLHHVAREIAARPCPPCGYVLVGSRPLTLTAAAQEAFANATDKVAIIPIDGLSHAEAATARPELSLPQRLLRGGFPALYTDASDSQESRQENPPADHQERLRGILADHLARELPLQLRVDSVYDFERFLRAVAQRTGRLLNKAELAREIGIAGSTAAIWLDTLADAGVLSLVRPWRPPQGRPLVKSPKLYVCDTGLCASLLSIRTAEDLAESPHAPALWETYVYGELRRLVARAMPRSELAFWRDRTKEANFLFPSRRGLVLADASWSEFPSPAAVARLLRIRATFASVGGAGAISTLAVVCRSPHGQTLREPAGPAVETVGLDDLPDLVG